ncbi:hypothetical protein ACFL3H_00340 [Gemmatimonadota bacterium]
MNKSGLISMLGFSSTLFGFTFQTQQLKSLRYLFAILLTGMLLTPACTTAMLDQMLLGEWKSHADQASIEMVRDDFHGTQRTKMILNELDGGGHWASALFLNPQLLEVEGSSPVYLIHLRYVGDDWLFIEEGESLGLIIDGERVFLSGNGSNDTREVKSLMDYVAVQEEEYYTVSPDFIRRLATADSVRARIDGSSSFIERHFGPVNFANLQRFVQECLPPAQATLRK